MELLDALIIYAACGSPFAMYRIAVADVASPRVIAKSAVYLLLWPVSALRFVVWHLPRVTFRRRASIREIRDSIENSIFAASSMDVKLRFRDAFDRYAAFATAGKSAGGLGFLKLSGHPDPRLAIACLERRSRQMIGSGLAISRTELVSMIDARDRVGRSAHFLISLASAVGDKVLRDRFVQSAKTENRLVPSSAS
jgi:hypothetical protein